MCRCLASYLSLFFLFLFLVLLIPSKTIPCAYDILFVSISSLKLHFISLFPLPFLLSFPFSFTCSTFFTFHLPFFYLFYFLFLFVSLSPQLFYSLTSVIFSELKRYGRRVQREKRAREKVDKELKTIPFAYYRLFASTSSLKPHFLVIR